VVSKGTQTYIFRYPFSLKLPSHPGYHISLSRVPCAILIGPCWLSSLNKQCVACPSRLPNQPFPPSFPSATICSFPKSDWWSYFKTTKKKKTNKQTKKTTSSVQLLSHVRLFATPWIAACQGSLSITNSRSSLKLMSIESVMPSSHLILCCSPFLLPPIPPSIRVFSNESTLLMRWPKYWSSASASVLPMNTQDWSPLGWTSCVSLQSKGLSRVFSNTTVQKHQFFGAQLSL